MANSNFGVIDFPSAESLPHSAVSRVMGSLAATRRELAAQWAALPPADVQHHHAGRLGQIHRLIHSSGLRDTPPDDADRAFVVDLKASLSRDDPRQVSPGKLLAAML